jgi:UDP-N-acetylglucosamine 2-epimerase (non-hydrolysing)
VNFLDIIVGTRPNFVKASAIIRAIDLKNKNQNILRYRLIHTGQHYDVNLSNIFFEQLGIPNPDFNLGVSSGTPVEQSAEIMVLYEKLLLQELPKLCLVLGDVTSTMACALTAQKNGIAVAHVEGGIRSGDWAMPEEINRIVTDSISNWFFTTSENANINLRNSGVSDERIFFVGNTMIDTLSSNLNRLQQPKIFSDFGLAKKKYLILTLHRPDNVDQKERFSDLLRAIALAADDVPVIFPIHPRTVRSLSRGDLFPDNLLFVDPQPYLEFNYLLKNSMGVLTDSGGVTEEATFLGVPCITLRENTERPETVTIGTNVLIGKNLDNIAPSLKNLFLGKWKKGEIPEKWDGLAGARIVEKLEELICLEK